MSVEPEKLAEEAYAPPVAEGVEASSDAGARSAMISLGCAVGAGVVGAGTIAATRATGSVPVGATGFALATLVAVVGAGYGIASLGQAARALGRGFPLPAFLLVLCNAVLTLLGALLTFAVLVVSD